MPVASRSTAALNRRYLAKLGSSTSTAGSGYRPNAGGVAATASAAPPAAIMVRLVESMGFPPRCVDGSGEYRWSADGAQTLRFPSPHSRSELAGRGQGGGALTRAAISADQKKQSAPT